MLMQVRGHDPRIEALKDAGLPFVLIGQTADNTGLAYVDIDIIAAMTWCVSHLAELGHRHIACLHQDDPEFGFGARVLAGYRMACADHGFSPSRSSVRPFDGRRTAGSPRPAARASRNHRRDRVE